MYKMMTAKEAIDMLFKMPKGKMSLDFTFDDIDEYPDSDVGNWYGVKITSIFDEYDGLFAIGYYGGGSTVAYDLYGLVDSAEHIKDFCIEKFQEFMNTWHEVRNYCEKVCVEIKED